MLNVKLDRLTLGMKGSCVLDRRKKEVLDTSKSVMQINNTSALCKMQTNEI